MQNALCFNNVCSRLLLLRVITRILFIKEESCNCESYFLKLFLVHVKQYNIICKNKLKTLKR